MTPDLFLRTAIVPALALLPDQMDSAEARAMILAIALQESSLRYRRQRGNGPARSLCQFEKAGIGGVLLHPVTILKATALCEALSVEPTVDAVYAAIEYQDVLCAGFARLLLWTSPLNLAGPAEPPAAWRLYLDSWKPGAPRPDEWRSNFAIAWHTVLQGRHVEDVLKA